jgi:hypothetical protein
LALVSAVVTRVWAVPTASWPGVSIVRKAGGLTQPTAHHSLSAAEVSDAIDAGRAMSVDKAVQYVLEGPAG